MFIKNNSLGPILFAGRVKFARQHIRNGPIKMGCEIHFQNVCGLKP